MTPIAQEYYYSYAELQIILLQRHQFSSSSIGLIDYLKSILNQHCVLLILYLHYIFVPTMETQKNHYEQLGIDRTATLEEIKKQYKKLALKHHPDKNPNDKETAKKRFTKIAEAYSVLSDPDKREAYNRELDRPPFEHFQTNAQNQPRYTNHHQFKGFQMPQQQNFDFEDVFRQFQGFRPDQGQPQFRQERQNRQEVPLNMGFGMFDREMRAPTFSRLNSFSGAFGSRFTFEMAQDIFNSVFQQPRSIQGGMNSSLHRSQSMREDHHYEPKEYVPKNSQLLSEKRVEKNGKQVLVKKYSIKDRDGGTHTETIETVLGKSSSVQNQSTSSNFKAYDEPQFRQSQQPQPHFDLFKKKSMNEKASYGESGVQNPEGRKGGVSTLQRLSSMRGTTRK